MKIAIVNNCVPFTYGGAEFLASSLKNKLTEYGHEAEVIKIPFKWHPPQKILEHMLSCRLLRLEPEFVDMVIALKFPVYYIKHPNKVLWLLHQFRQAYDLWGTPYQELPDTPEGLRIRDAIIKADNLFLWEAKKIFTISKVTSDRLKKFNGIDSEVLYPPLMEVGNFHCDGYGDFILYPSRITRGKRQDLAIESMKYTESDVRLVIAGKPDTYHELKRIKSIIRKNKVDKKVELIDRWISEEKKVELFAGALGCLYIPYDEDYGFVSFEAFHSKKPVITCIDSGGTLEVVNDGVSGFIVPPEPKEIAAAMDRLYNDKKMSQKMGKAGLEKIANMNLSWEHVIESLIE